MNIIFISIGGLDDLGENSVYPDLLRMFRDNGHTVYVVCQRERRYGKKTEALNEHGINVIRVKTGNITKTNTIEKGISTLLIGVNFKNAIKRYTKDVKFDLVLYSTPPITVASTVAFLKKRDNSFSYLMLKDIFPQNAIDLGMLISKGIKKYILRYFLKKERLLYQISDYIGCMSNANVEFLLKNNSYIDRKKVGLCPNTINLIEDSNIDKRALREKYRLPTEAIIFVYGGNFGRPQNVEYIIEALNRNKNKENCHFVMCGSGTDFYKIEEFINKNNECKNITVINSLSKKSYGELLNACDVGLIFLDYRFTIPNFPSRLLDYLNHKLPVFACTDVNTDLGKIILDGKFGWWCESSNVENFQNTFNKILLNQNEINEKGLLARKYLEDNYKTDIAYNNIMQIYNKFK